MKQRKGLFFFGEPGVGKTLLAECFMDALKGYNKYYIRKNKPTDKFINEITKVFKEAKINQPSVILLDDIDKFANEDEFKRDSQEYVTIQSCVDEVRNDNVFVIATANMCRKLPTSLVRDGRFDIRIEVNPPTVTDLELILKKSLERYPYIKDVDTKELAYILEGNSCSSIENVINQAGLECAYNDRNVITQDDLVNACLKEFYGVDNGNTSTDDKVSEDVIVHEAGHAVVSEMLFPGSVNLISVSNRNQGKIGLTSCNKKDSDIRKKIENDLICLLAGRAAVDVILNKVDCGSGDDIDRFYKRLDVAINRAAIYDIDLVDKETDSISYNEKKEAFINKKTSQFYEMAKMIIEHNITFANSLIIELKEKKTLLRKDIERIKKEACLQINKGLVTY